MALGCGYRSPATGLLADKETCYFTGGWELVGPRRRRLPILRRLQTSGEPSRHQPTDRTPNLAWQISHYRSQTGPGQRHR